MPLTVYWGDGWWWEELPENAKQAAKVLAYNQSIWDDDEYSSYHDKPFEKLSLDEKRAALFIGLAPLDDKFKEAYWEDINEETKKHAKALGFDQHKWDDDWRLQDLEVEHLYWKDLTEEQQDAAEFFGYTEGLWNEDGQEQETFSTAKPDKDTEEEAPAGYDSDEDGGDDKEDQKEDEPAATKPPKKKMNKPRKKLMTTRLFGGDGKSFDQGAHRHIDQLTVFAKGNTVYGIKANYKFQKPMQAGTSEGDDTTAKFGQDEFIVAVKVRATNHVHSVTFVSNRGTVLGPCGGDKGDEHEIKAPSGMVLVGLVGATGKPLVGRTRLNSIGFKWGPNPKA